MWRRRFRAKLQRSVTRGHTCLGFQQMTTTPGPPTDESHYLALRKRKTVSRVPSTVFASPEIATLYNTDAQLSTPVTQDYVSSWSQSQNALKNGSIVPNHDLKNAHHAITHGVTAPNAL